VSTTLLDVARAARVSASTVSRAIRGRAIDPAIRETVLRIASNLGYRPNRSARGLITGRTGNVVQGRAAAPTSRCAPCSGRSSGS
jgi:LacI family transcriptional regulator